MSELPKAYDPATVEPDLYADWMAAGCFHAEPDDDGEPFAIVIPPPNVTGSLHVGHALDNTIQDIIIRRERMRGRNAVWIPGTDHAGIATQNVVEKQLAAEGVTRHDLGRETFLERVWAWREESGGVILDQLKQLGASCDWEREAFTFDEPRSRAVREVFVSLYEQGLVYRGNRLINWCPRCATALSDIEVEHEEVRGELAHLVYPLVDPQPGDPDGIEVATTRAETMLGDTAIAVHPGDERYTALVGRRVRHPFHPDRVVPIIADDYVDPEFGTGAVKITPAHDPNDHAMGERHGLEVVDVMTDDATMSEAAGEGFAGLDRFEARRVVKERLDELGLLREVEEHVHQVGHCSRCHTVVEPRLSDQWFVAVRQLADAAAAAVRDGRITFVPDARREPFLQWLDDLYDWCISRQIWWGHRIPAWYGPDGEVEVSREDLDREGWVQDEDVLDTWFSSQLWPFTVLGWEGPDSDTPELSTWFPTSTLVTGYDINTFWVSRMVMSSLWLFDEVPFRVVHNHGLVRDEHGKKMSKSFGNVIDPLDLIAAHGADATRMALVKNAAPGADVPLSEEWVEGERKFANKLFNAVRFALTTLEGTRPGALPPADALTLEDRWVLSRLEAARAEADAGYEAYDWPRVARSLRTFAWSELADWYLEAVKVRLYGDDADAIATARAVLAAVLDQLLRLLHPVMPFVTESLWRALTGAEGGRDSLMLAAWPEPLGRRDEQAEADFAAVQDLVTELRRFRSQNDVPPKRRFPVDVVTGRRELLEAQVPLVTALAGLEAVSFLDAAPADDAGTSRVVFADGEAHVALAGLIDVAAELARLRKEHEKASVFLAQVQRKLANEQFVANAPAAVVEKERAKVTDTERLLGELGDQIATLEMAG